MPNAVNNLNKNQATGKEKRIIILEDVVSQQEQTYHSGWVSLALVLFAGPMMDFQWAIALLRARVRAMMGPELMKAVKLGKKNFPYWSA